MKAVYGSGEKQIECDSEQIHFMLGFEGVSIHDDACHSQGVLAQILGGGMASRLYHEDPRETSSGLLGLRIA
jgi:predicted Zn-dependent peptidase